MNETNGNKAYHEQKHTVRKEPFYSLLIAVEELATSPGVSAVLTLLKKLGQLRLRIVEVLHIPFKGKLGLLAIPPLGEEAAPGNKKRREIRHPLVVKAVQEYVSVVFHLSDIS